MTILVIFFSFNRINGIKINREKALHKVANTKNRINCFSLFWIKQLKDNNTKNNPNKPNQNKTPKPKSNPKELRKEPGYIGVFAEKNVV